MKGIEINFRYSHRIIKPRNAFEYGSKHTHTLMSGSRIHSHPFHLRAKELRNLGNP
jgi:hypothetical protein